MTSTISRRTFVSGITAAGVLGHSVPSLERPFAGPVGARPPTAGRQESDASLFAAARRELLFPPDIAFCNTGTAGASPREVVDAVVSAQHSVERELPDWAYRLQPTDVPPYTGSAPLPQFREEVGAFLNTSLDEIAFTQNTTMGMSFLANGLDLEPGDEVLTTDQEHPGGISPWQLRERRHGVVVRQLALGPALERGPENVIRLFADATTPRTRVMTFSHITSRLGIRLPVRELCALAHARRALAIVDGAQAVGQIRVDLAEIGCDAYAISGHKWLLGPKGTGILYIRRAAQDRFWSTLATTGFDDRSAGAFRFMHSGIGSMPTVKGLLAAVRYIGRLGIDRIERWDGMLTTRLPEGLARIPHTRLSSPSDGRFAAAMTTFAVAGRTSDEVQDELWKHGIRVRAQGDAGVRLSAHFYVAPADIDRVLDVVDAMR